MQGSVNIAKLRFLELRLARGLGVGHIVKLNVSFEAANRGLPTTALSRMRSVAYLKAEMEARC
jgi:hypothetical protein